MSQFRTYLPVNVEEILDSLPRKGLTVHSVTYNPEKRRLEIVWETPRFHTGRSVPIEYSLESLTKRKLPKGVRDLSKKEPISTPVTTPAPEPPKPVPTQNYIRTKEGYEHAVTQGQLEYQGIEPVWKLVPKDHQFTEGFFYRQPLNPVPVIAGETVIPPS
jgi:hypothetical protein